MISFMRKLLLKKLETPGQNYEQRTYNNLSKLYSVIKPGDIVLVEGRSEMSRLIKLFTRSHWSHVSLYVGDSLLVSGKKDKKYYSMKYGKDANHMLVEADSADGVTAVPLIKYREYNIRICRPYGILESDLHQVVQQVSSKIGLHYDNQNILAIAFMTLQAIFRTKSKVALRACLGNCNNFQVICSGMIAQAFQSVGYPIVPELQPLEQSKELKENNPYGGGLAMRHYTQIMPRDFDLSPNFEIIKYNIIGTGRFDYKSLWIDRL